VSSRNKLSPSTGKSNGVSGAALHHYQAAVQLLQQGKYEKALTAFEKLLPDAPGEIRERCRMYIAGCRRQTEKPVLKFLTPEEHYDYAISLLNSGYFEDAREQFQGILASWPDADFAFYGLAALDAMTSQAQGCLDNLARAIVLNPRNRLQARVDNDFQNMVDDPRFTELLYPEIP
jgi:tetratricopeptide (TPR) repeat protein